MGIRVATPSLEVQRLARRDGLIEREVLQVDVDAQGTAGPGVLHLVHESSDVATLARFLNCMG